MKIFRVFKAQGIGRDEEVRSASLVASEPVYDLKPGLDCLDRAQELYAANAQVVVEFLTTTLPQGTVDQVLCLLMQSRASLFVGPMKEEK